MKLDGVADRLDVTKSDLSGSAVVDANLSGWTLENANLAGWKVENANLSGWRAKQLNLSGASYTDCNFTGASLYDMNMAGWMVDKVILSGLKLSNANLKGASISGCRMDGMTIDGVLVSELLAAYHAAKRPSADDLDPLLEKLLSLPKNELEKSLAAVNAYLASSAGQNEFGLGPHNVSSIETKV